MLNDFNQPRGSTLGLFTPNLPLKKRLDTLPNILDFASLCQTLVLPSTVRC